MEATPTLPLEAKMLLDVALNMGSFYSPDYLIETVEILTGKERSEVMESWESLNILNFLNASLGKRIQNVLQDRGLTFHEQALMA